jgi:nitrite reductase/ring-hydroxylating ferredoxin subunit
MLHYACEWKDLQDRIKMRVMIGKFPILLASVQGRPYAVIDKCPHMGFSISNGKFDSGIIQCKEHGLQINVTNGQVVDTPKANFLKISPLDRLIRTFECVIENEKVYIEM